MSAAELRVTRERLGLPIAWISHHLHVAERSVTRWEAGGQPVPAGIAAQIRRWRSDTDTAVDQTIRLLAAQDRPTIRTWRTDTEYHTAHPDQPWPASWHRALVGRVAEHIAGLSIDYQPNPPLAAGHAAAG